MMARHALLRQTGAKVVIATALLLLSCGYLLQAGPTGISFEHWFSQSLSANESMILWQLRLPRLLLAVLVGAALAGCGFLLQLLTRNELADPYLFGVVSGAGLGATLCTIGWPEAQIALPLAAFIGASLTLLLVLIVARTFADASLLLTGIALSFAASSLTTMLLFSADAFAANRIMFWLMGSLNQASWTAVALLAMALLLCSVVALIGQKPLQAISCSDAFARSLGVHVTLWRSLFLLCCALLTALVVSFCGGIGFVGLMMPHIARLLFGGNYRAVFFGSLCSGGLFLLWTDHAARTLWPPQELPLGAITALSGSLFFFVLLHRHKRNYV